MDGWFEEEQTTTSDTFLAEVEGILRHHTVEVLLAATYIPGRPVPRGDARRTPQRYYLLVTRFIAKKEVRVRLCAGLKAATDDIFDIAKVIVPILLSLDIAGEITVPTDPILHAVFVVVIARMGVASLCAETPTKKDDKGAVGPPAQEDRE